MLHFHRNGAISSETYYHRGKRHRVDGPALVGYDEDGTVIAEDFELRGKTFSSHDRLLRNVIGLPAEKLAAELRTCSYGVLLGQGYTADQIGGALISELRTVEGIGAYLSGSPLEWALAFESGTRE